MEPIRTFVFFDVETTGLASPVQITELAMVAVSRSTLLRDNNGQLPRVMPKLVIQVKPTKGIESKAVEITGLDEMLLEESPPFNDATVTMIESFLRQYQTPIALVAHNGFLFDFPILRRQLGKRLGGEIYAVDSMKLFRQIEGAHGNAAGYTLIKIHERYFGRSPEKSHAAEADCFALLNCCIAIKSDFVAIADNSKRTFDDIPPR